VTATFVVKIGGEVVGSGEAALLASDLRHLVVRTTGDPLALTPAVRAAVKSVDGELVLTDVTSMAALVDVALGGARFGMQLLSGFALVALLMAALGIYGVVAFVVSRRTREVGIRMALGAQGGDVVRMIFGQGAVQLGVGMAVGLAFAFGISQLLKIVLFQVQPRDPVVFGGVAAVLIGVGLLACFVPARRATLVDPLVALRSD